MSTMNVHMDIKENKVIKREIVKSVNVLCVREKDRDREREWHVGVKRENHEPKTIQNRYY